MIKSNLLQIASSISKPSVLLSKLNEILLFQNTGNFVTAFYGIYHQVTREFIYSSAGHNTPYIISNNKIEELDCSNNGYPLAIINNEEINKSGKSYQDIKIRLGRGSKLLLFTDGLVEAVSISEQKTNEKTDDFGSTALKETLLQFHNLPVKKFLDNVVLKLVEFREDTSFDDDVCIICLDVQ